MADQPTTQPGTPCPVCKQPNTLGPHCNGNRDHTCDWRRCTHCGSAFDWQGRRMIPTRDTA